MSITNVLPKMVSKNYVDVLVLNNKTLVYTLGDRSLTDDDCTYMGFTDVYGITEREEPIRGTYYSLGSGEYLVIGADDAKIVRLDWEGLQVTVLDSTIIIFQYAESGVMYVRWEEAK
jgi:hypothetical protein